MKCIDVECAVAEYFNPRINLIVPNISWGFLFYEVDVLVVTPAGYCYEVEIKISKADIKADLKKSHKHNSDRIKKLYFAIPDDLKDCIDLIPERAGILEISSNGSSKKQCRCIREPVDNKDAKKVSEEQRYKVARLGSMRIWNLKNKIRNNDFDLENINKQKSIPEGVICGQQDTV